MPQLSFIPLLRLTMFEEAGRMRSMLVACAFLATAAAFAGPAGANTCRTDSGRTCATEMPIDGYCTCGNEGGTVVSGAASTRTQTPAPPPAPPHP